MPGTALKLMQLLQHPVHLQRTPCSIYSEPGMVFCTLGMFTPLWRRHHHHPYMSQMLQITETLNSLLVLTWQSQSRQGTLTAVNVVETQVNTVSPEMTNIMPLRAIPLRSLHLLGEVELWTYIYIHKRRLYTWTSPDGQHRNQIDYSLCSQRWRSSTQSAKTRLALTVAQTMNSLLPNSDLNWRNTCIGRYKLALSLF